MIFLIGTLLVAIRVTSMFIVAPILGNRSVPVYVKLFLAMVISLAVSPMVIEQSGQHVQNGELVSIVLSEAIAGSFIGIGILVIFSAAMMIGAAIGQMSGFQIDSLIQPGEFGQEKISQLIGLTAAVVFVMSGGLELLLSTVIESFLVLPLGQALSGSSYLETITMLLDQSFELTIRAIAPAIATLLISTISVGFVSRLLPQINLIQVGISSNIGLVFAAVGLTLGGCIWFVIDDLERASDLIIHSMKVNR